MRNVTVRDIDLGEKANEKLIRRTILNVLNTEVKEQQKIGGFSKPIYRNDGKYRFKNAYDAAKNTRGIVDVFDSATSLVDSTWYIVSKIKKISPVKSGQYLNRHFLDVNGRTYNLKNISSKKNLTEIVKDAKIIRIYNNSVYANKLERYANKSSKRQSKPQSNISFLRVNGIYEFFARKTNLLSLRNVYVRVGRSDYLPVIKDPRYTLKDGSTLVLPVIEIKLLEDSL